MKNYIRKVVTVTHPDGKVQYVDHWRKLTLTDTLTDAHSWVFEKTLDKFSKLVAEKYPDATISLAVKEDTPDTVDATDETDTVDATDETDTIDATDETDTIDATDETDTIDATDDFEDLEEFNFED